LAPFTDTGVNQLGDDAAPLRDTARIQAIALALVALTTLLAGALVIGQAIGRMTRFNRPDLLALRELGVDRPTLVLASSIAFWPAAAAGVVLALVGAWIGSQWFPTGLLGRAEVSRGMQIDGLVFVVGAAAVCALVAARVAIGALRATTPTPPRRVPKVSWTDRAANALSPAGATGVRWVIGRADTRRPLTGVVAAIVGVTGLLAVATYADQLEHIMATPAAYGEPTDAASEGGDSPEILERLRTTVLAQEAIGDVVEYTVGSRVDVNGVTMQSWSFKDARGHIEPTVVRGRTPTRDTEALLGTRTARQLHAGIGDRVRVVGDSKDEHELTVVGTGLFPNADTDAIATGIVTTPRTLAALEPNEPRYGVAFQWKPGADVEAATEALSAAEVELTASVVPPDIANMRIVRSYPWWLAAFLVILAMLATTNALVVSTRGHRHEMAVLGALGFTRQQLAGVLAMQGATVGALAAIFGIPAGLLLGKWLWTTHADRIGLSPEIALPLGPAFAVGAITVALTCAIAIAVGWGALRTRLATALRTE
jgi:hypothetical protein